MSHIADAKATLVHYFDILFQATKNRHITYDEQAEIEHIVDDIVDAAKTGE